MKKILTTALLLLMTILVAGCGTSSSSESIVEQATPQVTQTLVSTFTAQSLQEIKSGKSSLNPVTLSETIDIDLSQLNSTMAYAAMYDMIFNVNQHIGKTLKLRGSYQSYQSKDTGEITHLVLLVDKSACCEISIDFILTGEHSYPDDYPAILSEIELVGIMSAVDYDGYDYPVLLVNEIKTIKSSDLNLKIP